MDDNRYVLIHLEMQLMAEDNFSTQTMVNWKLAQKPFGEYTSLHIIAYLHILRQLNFVRMWQVNGCNRLFQGLLHAFKDSDNISLFLVSVYPQSTYEHKAPGTLFEHVEHVFHLKNSAQLICSSVSCKTVTI